MRFFSRNQEAVAPVRADVPFESLRRSPRNVRKPGAATTARSSAEVGAPLDPAEASKTRSRRRLIGAVALALAAIVFVPMLFDRTPGPPADDIDLQIPSRDTPFEGRRGVPEAARGPLRPSGDTPALSAPTPAPAPEAPVIEGPAPAPDARANVAQKPVETPTVAPPKPVAPKPAEKVVEKPRLAPQPTDDPRALAALEGKSEPASPEAVVNKSYAVQIAAFSAADKAKGLRDQLVAGGLKSYTESVSTAQGLRVRVRLGPFASREAADKARQKLKTMKLDGSVVPL